MIGVSVVIATYCRPDVLRRAIQSALDQTAPPMEVVITVEQDDHGTIAAMSEIVDPKVKAIINPRPKNGPGPARDLAVKASRGQWIAFLDDDDAWAHHKLERQLASATDQTISMTLTQVVTRDGTYVRPTDPYRGQVPIDEWLFDRRSWFKSGQSMLQTSSLMVPRSVFDHVGFGTARHEEWELVIRAVKQHGYQLITVEEPLVTYHAGNSYPWHTSLIWVDGVRDLISRRAYSGFCLNVMTQGLQYDNRNREFMTFLRRAFRYGRPTAKQLFAFACIWILPDDLRKQLRARVRWGTGRTQVSPS